MSINTIVTDNTWTIDMGADKFFELNPDAIETPEDALKVLKVILKHINVREGVAGIDGIEEYFKVTQSNLKKLSPTEIAKLKSRGVEVVEDPHHYNIPYGTGDHTDYHKGDIVFDEDASQFKIVTTDGTGAFGTFEPITSDGTGE
jgi:hypothetical protein